ncbi:MAG: hypothetical protein E7262_01575 [Lachnospiraceae bacterium]|nr:hypothetical protein [Lachnospiraceae bacterium]
MLLEVQNYMISALDIIFIAVGLIRTYFTYLVLVKVLERRDSKGYKYVFFSFIFPIVAYVVYKKVIEKEKQIKA